MTTSHIPTPSGPAPAGTAHRQYLDLYEAQRDLIDAHSVAAMNAWRPEAARVLARVGLARPADATQVDPEALLAPDYALNLARHEVPTRREDLFTCGIPELSTQTHFLVNEQYVRVGRPARPAGAAAPDAAADAADTPAPAGGQGWFAGSMRDFARLYPDVMERHYGRLAMADEPPYDRRTLHTSVTAHRPLGEAALSTLLAQDGFVLYVPDGVTVGRPLQLIALLRSVDDLLACQRLLVIVGRRAQASLLVCDHDSELADCRQLALQVAEIYVGEGATFDLCALEEHSARVARLASLYVEQQAASACTIGLYGLQVGHTRTRVYADLVGEGAHCRLYGACIADREQRLDTLTYVRHRVAGCTSEEVFKYVLDEAARGSFVGRILVERGAVRTDARQTDRNLLLTPEARMTARPELEIYADDVKCAHGATSGQLDQQALFYMRSRGVAEAEARMLLMFAFMADVIDGIRIEPVRDRVRHLVERRFRGELRQCKNCATLGAVSRP